MLKYKEVEVTLKEIPFEVSLCINISNCPIHCKDCHSKHLWKDEGEMLDWIELKKLIDKNEGVSCICFMGGDREVREVKRLCEYIKIEYGLKTAWYSGQDTQQLQNIRDEYGLSWLNYIKLGPYKKECGGLDSPTTNQRLYMVGKNEMCVDITKSFKKK